MSKQNENSIDTLLNLEVQKMVEEGIDQQLSQFKFTYEGKPVTAEVSINLGKEPWSLGRFK
jgi:hypothetical protein